MLEFIPVNNFINEHHTQAGKKKLLNGPHQLFKSPEFIELGFGVISIAAFCTLFMLCMMLYDAIVCTKQFTPCSCFLRVHVHGEV